MRIKEDCKRDRNIQEDTSINEVLKLLIQYIICKLNLQKILFLLSFLSFGAADGISAAYMIEKKGVFGESNPLIQFMYISNGSKGVIGIKLWLVIILLSFIWSMSKHKENYWMINGFLFSLFMCGLMATGANLMAARGLEPPASNAIITTYLFMVILLTMLGEAIDKLHL
jgi:Domain of unknown function (DUF5658)